jgi:hypothetical protein
MAQIITSDAFISIGGVDYSDQLLSATLSYEADQVENTTMGATTHTFAASALKNWSLEAEFAQDEASGQTGANLFALVSTSCALLFRPDNSDGVSATNPNYTGSGILVSYTPLQASVGELSKCRVSFVPAGTLSRATS